MGVDVISSANSLAYHIEARFRFTHSTDNRAVDLFVIDTIPNDALHKVFKSVPSYLPIWIPSAGVRFGKLDDLTDPCTNVKYPIMKRAGVEAEFLGRPDREVVILEGSLFCAIHIGLLSKMC